MREDVAIRCHGLGKRYWRTGGRRSVPPSVRPDGGRGLNHLLACLWRRARSRDELWALRGVSFELARGEALGVIGPNGSGKSTLLKILAGVSSPTEGRYEIEGRVAALLELGAGFSSEFTGRENVFLNGAVLGMTRREINAEFDAIVDFAGVRDFVDMPVKHYSSGMAMRLGFSIAVHTEPDVLLVDEVLAVGDAEFREKCLERVQSMMRAGMAVLLVTHSMSLVRRCCERAVMLSDGAVEAEGTAGAVSERYSPTRTFSASRHQ